MLHPAVIALLLAIEGSFALPPSETSAEAEARRVREAHTRHVERHGIPPARIFVNPHGVAFAVPHEDI